MSKSLKGYRRPQADAFGGTTAFAKGTQISVADTFSGSTTLALKKPKHVCTPVDREGDGVKNAGGYLVCYLGKPAKGQPAYVPQTGVHVVNPQSGLTVSTIMSYQTCIPSILLP